MTPLVVHAFGPEALLVETADVLALRAVLATPPDGVTDVVPAAATVLVCFDSSTIAPGAVRAWIDRAAADAGRIDDADASPIVEIDVCYDGPDLVTAAAAAGVAVDTLISAHQRAHWRVAFTGFAPGFGYLVADDWPYRLPRLAAPRTRVPRGSVALADGFSGVYPRATPGGWQLIGVTDATLFDPDRTPPALLVPGARVRFREMS
ncbi:5-oxoprolinase subunit B family protein [Microbacterium nymphoidis]|uniref:5-oxoprolinase subunit B family protein n=1 Tax=Microbacterium nymphoidis TaxID=2898586 RepID=UPI001E29D03B|nr:allophanate hydrolase subunit 1 [Microbacterium nymphoidis]MCD2498673.1 allophanate hydrolase subunit 1 [Microbacterium nymphoidis]